MAAVAAATVGISELVKLLERGREWIQPAKDRYDALQASRMTSIAEHIRDTMIISSVYTEQVIVDEEIYPAILSTLHQIYGAYVLTAIGLNEAVGGTKVRDLLRTVATESFVHGVALVNAYFDDPRLDMPIVSLEATSSNVIDIDTTLARLPAGKIIELTINMGKDNKPLIILMYVQLTPVAIPTDVADGFITLNFTDSLRRRWMKMKAGEIRFINDFIFQQYELEKLDTALRQDTTGSLAGMVRRQQNALTKAWARLIVPSISGKKDEHQNIASTTLVVSQSTFDRACKLAGVNFNQASDRNSFFGKSMMLMVVTVDTSFATATIYTHGLDTVGSYPFKTLEKVSNNGMNMKDVMTLMSRGTAPRF
jgi:hypothetical protein